MKIPHGVMVAFAAGVVAIPLCLGGLIHAQILNTKVKEYYYKENTVVELGQCKEKCAVRVKTFDGTVVDYASSNPLFMDQKLYTKCSITIQGVDTCSSELLIKKK